MNNLWDYRDDYYFLQIGDTEINVRAYSRNELSLWIYEYSSDEELVDADYKSLKQIQTVIKEIIGVEVILPKLEDLLKITNKEEKMKYDPKASYYERMNSSQRTGLRRRENHKFSDSIGGCSSNYRD